MTIESLFRIFRDYFLLLQTFYFLKASYFCKFKYLSFVYSYKINLILTCRTFCRFTIESTVLKRKICLQNLRDSRK